MLRFTKASLLVFFLLAFVYGYFYQDPGANGNSRLALTMALVKEGRVNIDSFVTDIAGYKTVDIATDQGKFYTDKGIGSSVLAAIVYYPIYTILRLFGGQLSIPVEKHLLTFLVIGLPSAFTGTLIYILCAYLSKSKFRAFIVTLAVALGTMSFPFSIIYYGHQLAASMLFGAFFMIFQIKTLPDSIQIKSMRIFWIGLLLGLALMTDMTTAVIVLPLVVYYFYVLWTKGLLKRVSTWAIPALGGLIPILMMIAYNVLAFGKPFASGYQYLVNPWFKEAMSTGIMGIGRPRPIVLYYETLHPAQGIFWQSPVLIMALVGGLFMLCKKQYWAELAVAVVACGAYLLLNSGYYMWWGGWSFGARQIVPMLPFVCIPLIFVPKRLFPLVIGLTFISVVQMGIVSASLIAVNQFYMERINQLKFFQYSTIYSDCLKELIEGRFAWNMGQAWLGLKQWASLLPVGLVISAVTVIFARMKTDPQETSIQA